MKPRIQIRLISSASGAGRLGGGLDRRDVGDAGPVELVGDAAVGADDEPLVVGVHVAPRLVPGVDDAAAQDRHQRARARHQRPVGRPIAEDVGVEERPVDEVVLVEIERRGGERVAIQLARQRGRLLGEAVDGGDDPRGTAGRRAARRARRPGAIS